MSNVELERNQAAGGTEIISEYVYGCKSAETESNLSEPACVLKAGIRLHFLRYGLFAKSIDTDNIIAPLIQEKNTKGVRIKDGLSCWSDVVDGENSETPEGVSDGTIQLSEVEVLSLKDLPHIDNFHVARTSLRKGFVYLINKDNNSDYYELEVDEQGATRNILWGYDSNKDSNGNYKDVRKAGKSIPFKTLTPPGKTFWIAFSPVQWSREYHELINSDEEKRKQRMVLVDCKGFQKGETEQKYSKAYSEIIANFYEDDVAGHDLQGLLNTIHCVESSECESGDNDLLEDMFITLHDPVGIAADMSKYLDDLVVMHQANVEAIRFGSNPAKVAANLKAGIVKEQLKPREEEMSSMFSLAQTTYQLVYNNSEMRSKYDGGALGWYGSIDIYGFIGTTPIIGADLGHGIFKEKLTDVLAVHERKAFRDYIISVQNDFGRYMSSDYLDKSLQDFSKGSDLCNIIGKSFLAEAISLLAVDPHDYDRSLDLEVHQESNAYWLPFIKESFLCAAPSNHLQKTLNRKVNINEKVEEDAFLMGISLLDSTAGFARELLQSISKVTKDVETVLKLKGSMDVIVKRLNKITAYGMDMYEVRASEIYAKDLPDDTRLLLNENDKGPYKGKDKNKARFKVDSPHIKLKGSAHGKHLFALETETITKRIEQQPTKFAGNADAVMNSKSFTRTVSVLKVFNLGMAVNVMIKDPNWKGTTNIGVTVAELGEAVLVMRNASVLRTGVGLSARATMISGAVSGLAGVGTVIMCTWDAYDSFKARDTDAAIAYTGAAIAFGGMTAVSIGATFAASSVFGPLGWICAGIGLGLLVLASYLKDSPLESYFKLFPFSDKVGLAKLQGTPTWEYNQRFFRNRKKLLGTDNKMTKGFSFEKISAEFHDLIVCSAITMKSEKRIDEETIRLPSYDKFSQTITTGMTTKFLVEVSFNQFLNDASQFVYEVHFYENGMKAGKHREIKEDRNVKVIKGTSEAPAKASVILEIPKKYQRKYNSSSCILFICRLQMYEHEYYPVDFDNTERSLGAIMGIKQTEQTMIFTNDFTFSESTCIAPKKDLLNYSAWKNKK